MKNLLFSHQSRQKLSTFLVILVAFFGVAGILFASFNQPKHSNPEVKGVFEEKSESSQSSDTNQNSQNNSSQNESQNSSQTSANLGDALANQQSSSASNLATQLPIDLSQVYTNPSYPDLTLFYPKSWFFSTKTSPSTYEGLANRQIILSKNSSRIVMDINLATPQACSGQSQISKQISLTNGLDRFGFSNSGTNFLYAVQKDFNPSCPIQNHKLFSTIQSEFFQNIMGQKQVFALVSINLVSQNQTDILEADQIMQALKSSSIRQN